MNIFSILVATMFWQSQAWSACIQAGQEQAEIKKITDARKASGFSTEPFLVRTYPPISFHDGSLPKVWLGPEFFELVGEPKPDGKSFYQGICSGFEDRTCVQWCFVRSDSPQFYSAQAYSKISDLCQTCDESKDKACEDVQYLKNSSSSLTMKTYDKKPVVLQMGVNGHLLVFQTGNEGKKDLAKPYIKLTYLNNGKSVFQKMETVGGANGGSSAQTFFTKDPRFGYYGFRVCDQAVLSTQSCDTTIQSTKETGIAFSCNPAGQTGPASDIEIKVRR